MIMIARLKEGEALRGGQVEGVPVEGRVAES